MIQNLLELRKASINFINFLFLFIFFKVKIKLVKHMLLKAISRSILGDITDPFWVFAFSFSRSRLQKDLYIFFSDSRETAVANMLKFGLLDERSEAYSNKNPSKCLSFYSSWHLFAFHLVTTNFLGTHWLDSSKLCKNFRAVDETSRILPEKSFFSELPEKKVQFFYRTEAVFSSPVSIVGWVRPIFANIFCFFFVRKRTENFEFLKQIWCSQLPTEFVISDTHFLQTH